MQLYREFDGITGTVRVTLVDLGNGRERVRLEHTVTPDLKPQALPKYKYFPKRIAGMVFPTRIIESVELPKGRFVPDSVAQSLVRKHIGAGYTVEWLGRGWSIELA